MTVKKIKTKKLGRPYKNEGSNGKALILQAALDLFSEYGYEGTSIKMIADKIGFRDTALYAHFKSKADLREQLMKMHGPHAVRLDLEKIQLAQIMADPKKMLKEILNDLAIRWTSNDESRFFNFLLMENLKHSTDPGLQIEATSKALRERVGGAVRMLLLAGRLKKMDPDWLTSQFLAPILTLRFEIALSKKKPSMTEVQMRLALHVDQFYTAFVL